MFRRMLDKFHDGLTQTSELKKEANKVSNLCEVTEASKPFYRDGLWIVNVDYTLYGLKSYTKLYRETEDEINKIKVGYKFKF